MANPFGGSDETLSKNTGHTNQANLIYAFVPRSTTKWREVVTATNITMGGGSYDADGFWQSNSTTRVDVSLTISLTLNYPRTIIAATTRTSGGDTNDSVGDVLGFWDSVGGLQRALIQCDRYSRVVRGRIRTSGGTGSAIDGTADDPGADLCGFALKAQSGNQNALSRVTGTTTQRGSDTSTTIGTSTAFDRVGVRCGTEWKHQYLFVYNAFLSDADINSIIDNPGGVISYTAAGGIPKTTRLTLMGIG